MFITAWNALWNEILVPPNYVSVPLMGKCQSREEQKIELFGSFAFKRLVAWFNCSVVYCKTLLLSEFASLESRSCIKFIHAHTLDQRLLLVLCSFFPSCVICIHVFVYFFDNWHQFLQLETLTLVQRLHCSSVQLLLYGGHITVTKRMFVCFMSNLHHVILWVSQVTSLIKSTYKSLQP